MTRPLRLGLALVTAVWFVAGVALGARHEAGEAHVIDARGAAVHASKLAGSHHGHHPDIHALDAATHDTDACTIVSALHQPGTRPVASPAAVAIVAPIAHRIVAPPTAPGATACTLLLAPKTSPPALA